MNYYVEIYEAYTKEMPLKNTKHCGKTTKSLSQ